MHSFKVAHAQYEVIKASTISNDVEASPAISDTYMPTYNDPELPDFSPEDSISAKAERGFKNFFEKRKQKKAKNEDSTDIINEDNLSSDESPITSNRDLSEQE